MTDTYSGDGGPRRPVARSAAARRKEKRLNAKATMDILVERLTKKIGDLNTSARTVSQAAGLADTYCHDILSRRNTTPSIVAIQQVARALDTTLAFLTGEADDKSNPNVERMDEMPVLATVEVGAARPVATSEDAVFTMIQAPRSPSYPRAVHFAVRIFDDCMNLSRNGDPPLLPGMTALCIDMKHSGLIVESQHLYCVRRTADAGRTWETLIRRAEVYRNRTVLIADTTNPEHQDKIEVPRLPIVPAMPWKNIQHPVVVFGLVYGAFSYFRK